MAVIRVEKTANYTAMSNFHLRDKRLSLKAVGLLSKILSLPPDWDYTVAGLACICKEGRGSIGSTLEELEAVGYVRRRQLHKEDGTFGGNEYVVFERPEDCPEENRDNLSRPLPGNPSTVRPSTDNPSTGNPAEINTDRLSTESIYPPIVPPEGDGTAGREHREKSKTAPKWKPERFAGFWRAYPRKESKQRATAAWDKLRPDDELLTVMAVALKRQMQTDQWTRDGGRFIPYAATWLNQRRWEDEPPPPGPGEGRELPIWT